MHLPEVVVLQILVELPFAEFFGAARRGHVRQMREGRQRIAQRRGDEHLARGVRQVLDRPDHMGNLEIMIVDGAGQMVETRTVGALHDMVLFQRPLELDVAPHQIANPADPLAGHLQTHRRPAPRGLERRRLGVGRRHPAPAVEKAPLLTLRRLAFGLDLVRGRVVPIRGAGRKQLLDRRPVAPGALRLVIRCMRPADLGPLIPVDAQPPEPVQNRLQRRGHVALGIGVVNPQQELPFVPAGEQPVEQRRAHAADVEVSGGTGREARTDLRHYQGL